MLYKALAVFSMRNINLTKIESRPQRKHPLRQPAENSSDSHKYFDYLFYCDFEASMADPNSQNALKHLKIAAKAAAAVAKEVLQAAQIAEAAAAEAEVWEAAEAEAAAVELSLRLRLKATT